MRRIYHEFRIARTVGAVSLAPLAVLVGLAAIPGVLRAQAQQQEQSSATEATSGPLQEITVTATRREESLSRVPISVTALTQEALDDRGIKDFSEVARFTPGVNFDNSGTNNISIRGISGTGGAGTTGIYIDDTPIQMRALAFSPDEALPKSFDIDRIEVLRGPQGTLFGAGSEGGTVRYITTQPSLTRTTVYGRAELAMTEGGDPSYEAGIAAGGPLVDDKLGARLTVWYRRDGGWIDHLDPYTFAVDKNANHEETALIRLAVLWAPSERWSFTPSAYYQDRQRHNISDYWPLHSDAGNGHFASADPNERNNPDRFYLAALKIQGDLGSTQLISNTSFYHRENQTGYEGTLYNLGYYQTQNVSPIFPLPAGSNFWPGPPPPAPPAPVPFPLLNGNGLQVPGGLQYHSPSTIDNGQENIVQEIRLQSTDPNARLVWTAGVFANENRQTYLEQIHDPMLPQLTLAVLGQPYLSVFGGTDYVQDYPSDSYFLRTSSKDQQIAGFGELTYSFTEQLKATVGARYSHMKYSFDTYTGGPQLFAPPRTGTGDITESAFTPKLSLQYQMDLNNLFYATYAKGFRPGGANNPIPNAACPNDFANFGINTDPPTFSSDSVKSYEVGAKNNFNNRVRLGTSIYYIQWNNIQQLIVPPVCQISFIANTGNAAVKGVDLQADFSVTSAFTVELALGYTQARYTEDFRFAPPCPGGVPAPGCAADPRPLVADGNAIVSASSETGGGQPTAPFTAAAGLEYHFPLFERESFVRLDAEYEAHAKWPTANLDPNTSQSDPANFVLPSTTFVSARAGMQFGKLSLQAFVDNLTDSHTITDYNNTINPLLPGFTRLQRDYTFRPRTFGITAIYHR
jgi:iron complex outermembrane recepter protein